MLKASFFSSLFLILYSYAIYPAVLIAWTGLRGRRSSMEEVPDPELPAVTVAVAAHNEEEVIAEKIRNTLAIDYPADRIEVIIGSDGSTDRTDEIVSGFDGVRLVRIEPRQGKANVLNTIVPQARGEIIIFSDSNTIIEPGAIRKMVAHLKDPDVGGVCGRLVLRADKDSLESYEGTYWRYETRIKEMEGDIYSTIGANGGIYGVRKELFKPIPEDTITDDFVISMNVLAQGRRMVFEKEAVAYEYVSKSFRDEFWRKVRIGGGNLQVLLRGGAMRGLPPFALFAYLSRKVTRWAIPVLMIILYASALGLYGSELYTQFFWVYNIGIVTAAAGIVLPTRNRFVNVLSYLFSLNLALLLGYIRYLLGLQKVTWRRATR